MSMLRFPRQLAVPAVGLLVSLVVLAGPVSATSVVVTGSTTQGNLELPPGGSVGAGYDLTAPAGATIYMRDATVWLSYACSKGGPTTGQLALRLPDTTLSGGGWRPAPDQHSPAVWQDPSQSVEPATSVCGGGPVWVNERTGGATFTGQLTSRPAGAEVWLRFHYRETSPGSSPGVWSPPEAFTASAAVETLAGGGTPHAAPAPAGSAAGSRPVAGVPGPMTSPASGVTPAGAATDLGSYSPPAGGLGTLPLGLFAGGGLAVLGGGCLLLADRRRRRAATAGGDG